MTDWADDLTELLQLCGVVTTGDQRAFIAGLDDGETFMIDYHTGYETIFAILGWLFLTPGPVMILYAGSPDARRFIFTHLDRVLGHPVLSDRVEQIRYTHGNQQVRLRDGSRILFTHGGARGYAADKLIIGPGVSSKDVLECLLPCMAGRERAQVLKYAD
jgi:hypothetical protein